MFNFTEAELAIQAHPTYMPAYKAGQEWARKNRTLSAKAQMAKADRIGAANGMHAGIGFTRGVISVTG